MIQFVNITQEDFLSKKILYKHMPLENALRFLKDKAFWFANPMTWKDPFEKRFIEAKYSMNGKDVKFRWRNRLFCTCMTQTVTSEAFWNTYNQGGIGIEFRFYREKVLEELSNYADKYMVFIGKAEYMLTDDIRKGLRQIPFHPPIPKDISLNSESFAARLFMLKRISFSYEDEIRIVIVKDKDSNDKGIALNYNCNNTDLIQSIIVDPNIEDYTFEMLNKVFINDYGFTPVLNAGKRYNRVLKSQLYVNPERAELKLD